MFRDDKLINLYSYFQLKSHNLREFLDSGCKMFRPDLARVSRHPEGVLGLDQLVEDEVVIRGDELHHDDGGSQGVEA